MNRYLFHDTWNLVDTSTIVTVSLAFLFRVLGMPSYGGATTPAEYFFAAQFFLALSAPLLFARLLRLSQIDDTLGPMTQVTRDANACCSAALSDSSPLSPPTFFTPVCRCKQPSFDHEACTFSSFLLSQIIWRMLSQTLRFGVFIVVVMAGFALAFHAVFFLCEDGTLLGGNFGSFASALLYVFEAPLGEFDFGDFDNVRGQCPDHPSPGQASDAGIFLLVVSRCFPFSAIGCVSPPGRFASNVAFWDFGGVLFRGWCRHAHGVCGRPRLLAHPQRGPPSAESWLIFDGLFHIKSFLAIGPRCVLCVGGGLWH